MLEANTQFFNIAQEQTCYQGWSVRYLIQLSIHLWVWVWMLLRQCSRVFIPL